MRPGRFALLAAALTALPGAAEAHLVTSGLGPFYDGALHLLLSPADLLGLAAAALLAGLRGTRAARLTVVVLPLCWLCAGLVAMSVPAVLEAPWLSVSSFMVLGVLVAADARLSAVFVAGLGGVYGGLHGLLNGSALAAAGAGLVSLLGSALTVLLLTLLTAAAVAPLRAFWARIAVRVAGSWVVAVGMLMLGWMARGAA